MAKIPEKYLEKALQILNRIVAEEHAKLFGEENLNDYGIDSTEDTCTTLKEVVAAMKTKLHNQTVKYHILSQLATNTVVAVGATKTSGDARPLLK